MVHTVSETTESWLFDLQVCRLLDGHTYERMAVGRADDQLDLRHGLICVVLMHNQI